MAAHLAMSQGRHRIYTAFSKQPFPKGLPLHPVTLPLLGRGLQEQLARISSSRSMIRHLWTPVVAYSSALPNIIVSRIIKSLGMMRYSYIDKDSSNWALDRTKMITSV